MFRILLVSIYMLSSLVLFGSENSDALKAIVFPFDSSGAMNSLSWLNEGLAESIANQIRIKGIVSPDRNERLRIIEDCDLPPAAALSRGSMIRVAQRSNANVIVFGKCEGVEQNLRIVVRILDIKSLKLSGEITVHGPFSALPQMENELSWMILNNLGLDKTIAKEAFKERIRKANNAAYSFYIQSLNMANDNERLQLLIKAVESHKNYPEAQYQIGKIYFQKKECGYAISHLIFGEQDYRYQVESEFMLGACYAQNNQSAQAIKTLSHLIEAVRPYEALNNLGVAMLRNGDVAEATNYLIEAKNLARADSSVGLNLAIARHLQGNGAAGLECLDEPLKAHPLNGMLNFMKAFLLKESGQSDKVAEFEAKAKRAGIKAEKLLPEPPASWAKPIMSWSQLLNEP